MTSARDRNGCTASIRRPAPDAVRLLCALALAGALVALAHFCGIMLCPLRRFFSIPCPTCGATRAVVEMAKCNVSGAFAIQPLVSALVLVVLPLAALSAAVVGRKRVLESVGRFARTPAVWVVLLLAVAANWVYVILRGN